jgi:hypothetical protein
LTLSFAFGQTLPSTTKSIFIKGRVYNLPKGKENYIPFATVVIKGTKIGSECDNLGYYSIDITTIADTIKQMTLYCAYVGCVTKEIEIKNKITQTTELDFELQNRSACELPDIVDGKGNKAKIDTAKFTKILMRGQDTLTFYYKQSNCDTAVFYKYQIFKGKNDFLIKSFFPISFKQPKKCYDLLTINPEKLNFKLNQTCDHSVWSMEFINEYEVSIRSIKSDTSSCRNKVKFSMTIGNKTYSNKNKTCRQDLAIKISNYFGCAIVDPDTKSQE